MRHFLLKKVRDITPRFYVKWASQMSLAESFSYFLLGILGSKPDWTRGVGGVRRRRPSALASCSGVSKKVVFFVSAGHKYQKVTLQPLMDENEETDFESFWALDTSSPPFIPLPSPPCPIHATSLREKNVRDCEEGSPVQETRIDEERNEDDLPKSKDRQ